jgi:peptidoglycan/xylan/chitin deacetylase (PgdA/CDA1 family)
MVLNGLESSAVLVLLLCLSGLTPADSVAPAVDPLDTVNLSGRVVILSADDGHRSIYEQVYPLLRRYEMTLTLGVIGSYVGGSGSGYGPPGSYMDRARIQEMIDSCDIEIASHSMSHAWLTRLDSADAWAEIHGSKVYLESLFGRPVVTFVYPYGDMNARVRSMVRRAGYRLGRAVRPGTPNFWTDPYRIPEVELRQETRLADVKRRIARGRVTVLLLHRIVPRPNVFTEWSTADFAALLQWLDERGARVATLADQYRLWWNVRLEKALREQSWLDPVFAPGRLFEDVEVDATGAAHSR